MKKEIIEEYKDLGYYWGKSIVPKDIINNINSYLESLDSKIDIPFTNVPWGWGNQVDTGPFQFLQDNSFIIDFCKEFLGDEFVFNHFYVHNKAPWVGLIEHWHQEIYNVNTFAPGLKEENWENLMQVFIALHDQDLENGCIKVIPKSHTLGLLEHRDVLGPSLGHKRSTNPSELQRAYEKFGIKNVTMKAGDVLFFNHLLLHGSTSNNGPTPRRAIVGQARKPMTKSPEIFEKENKHRIEFAINSLDKRVNFLKDKAKSYYIDSNKKS